MINEIIARITKLIPIDRIYLSNFEHRDMMVNELSFLMPNTPNLHIIEAKSMIAQIMHGYPDYRFSVYYTHEVKQAIALGSMVFYTICRDDNLVYEAPESTGVAPVPELSPNDVLSNANINMEKEIKKIGDFRKGAASYVEQRNYMMAAFMLHQVIELSFRIAELLVIGKEKMSHSIRNHQELMQHYAPEMGDVFNEHDGQEMRLLALLDEAYRCVPYDYKLSREDMLFFVQKADLIGERLVDLYETVIAQFEQNFIKNRRS